MSISLGPIADFIADMITGLVLAGGRGSRMGHVDKGLQQLHGEAMAAHVLRRLRAQVGQVAINANRNLDIYAQFGVPVWPDDLQGFEGPLAGLATGLRQATTPLVLSAPCDGPFLPPDLAARLYGALIDQNADLALPETREAGRLQPQPVYALVKRSTLPILSDYLRGGGRRMDGWYDRIRVARVPFEDNGAFRNINTLGELQQFSSP